MNEHAKTHKYYVNRYEIGKNIGFSLCFLISYS